MILTTNRRGVQNRKRGAFTLLEVLVVVAIIVILASVATVSVFGYLERAKGSKAQLQAKAIETAAKAYMLKTSGELPQTPEQLINPGNGDKPYLEGGREAIMSPWNTPFVIKYDNRPDNGERMIIVSCMDDEGKTHTNHDK